MALFNRIWQPWEVAIIVTNSISLKSNHKTFICLASISRHVLNLLGTNALNMELVYRSRYFTGSNLFIQAEFKSASIIESRAGLSLKIFSGLQRDLCEWIQVFNACHLLPWDSPFPKETCTIYIQWLLLAQVSNVHEEYQFQNHWYHNFFLLKQGRVCISLYNKSGIGISSRFLKLDSLFCG